MNDTSYASPNTTYAPPRSGGSSFKRTGLLLLVAFVIGAVAFGWAARSFGLFAPAPAAPAPAAAPAPTTTPEFDSNLGQIAADSLSATASGAPSRGDALLTVFAAKRALDGGTALGYLTEQLRVRFGGIQPKAVETIIAASQAPVTLPGLRAELNGLGPVLVSGARDVDLWAKIKRESSELFVLRRDNAPVDPGRQLVRVQALLESDNVPAAINEVKAMPGAGAAKSWLARAQRYADARAALALLERTAIVTGGAQAMVPPENPKVDTNGDTPLGAPVAPAADAKPQ